MDARAGSVLARKLNTFLALSPDELNCLAEMQSTPLKLKRGKQLRPDTRCSCSRLAGRAVTRTVGGSRQIISFPIAGDCVGLRSVRAIRALRLGKSRN